uniref:C-type lectin domain-containing protein n=1 Tax=Cyprinus carpio TaxID=7962 RepID=A0A8C2K8F3_CYPCA
MGFNNFHMNFHLENPALSASVNSYVFYLVSEKMNWTDALTYCRQHHTDLATINDQTDLTKLLKSLPSGFKDDFWIGLYRKSGSAPWVWSDGSISLFRPWLPSQPNNYAGIQHCVCMTTTGYWNDWECPKELPFMCYTGELLAAGRVQYMSNHFTV